MLGKGKLKQPTISLVIITGVLMLALGFGFTVGILSNDPDGLERALIDAHGGGEEGEAWIEDLLSPWNPPLGNISNDYLAGIIGIISSFMIMIGIFRGVSVLKKKKKLGMLHNKEI